MKKLLRLISVATMLLAATTFMACSSDDDDGPSESSSATRVGSGAFVGVVLDNTGKPVEGATVTLGNKTASTNKGGEFKLEGVAVNDPIVRSIQTTVGSGTATATNGDEKLEPKDSTSTSTERKYAYTLTVTKDGYIPGTVDSMYVSEAEDIGGIEDARLSALKNQYAAILNAYAGAVGASTVATNSNGDIYGITGSTLEDKSATMKTVAEALKEIQKLYANLGKTYSSTFVECKTLVPLNASLSGKLKLNPSPATAEVYNETTYPAPKDTVVTVAYKSADGNAPYTFKSKTDAEGNFKFEKLPSGVALSIEVEGFTAKAGEVEAYFSTDVGLSTYRSNAAELLNNGSYNDSTATSAATIKIDGNSLNVAGVDIMLFAQLEKIWVKETNLIKNNSAALISVKTPLEFTFNKAIQRVDIAGSGFQDVKDENYVVTIDSTDAKKVTITPKDGIWTPKAAGTGTDDAKSGEVRLSVLAADGTKELLNDKFTAYFDTTIYVEISDSSKNDVELGLTQPVKLTFSKPMTTASVVAYKVFKKDTKTALTNAFSKTWNEGKTELTLTPTTFWDEVSDDDGKVVFTVEGLAQDLTDDVKYWKNNVQTLDTGTATNPKIENAGLIAYFDNKIDVTVAKVDDKSFTLTFSKAIKALTKDDIASAVTVSYAATKAGLASGTVVSDYEAKFNDDNTVLTISAKNNDFANTGYYRVNLTNAVVGKTGETKFRVAGTTNVLTTKNFDTDFTVGPEKFAETAVEIVTELPAGAEQSRAVYVTAEKYLKLTFNKAVRSSKLSVYDKSTTSYKNVKNYVADKSVYLALNELSDDSELKVQGTVTAVDGATKKWETGKELDTGYALSKFTYKMVSTSLYKETVSIAAGQNDAKVEKIQPTDSITFTFDQDVSTAKWTAELYDSENVGSNDLTQTSYAVTATAAGKVVTVALTEASKKLDFDKTYYLSLKATKGNDVDTVVLFNTDKATAADFANLVSAPSTSLSTKILKTPVTGHNYIGINTVGYYVVPAGDKSATTKFDEFKKSINSPIVIEFTQDITGFTAVLANQDTSTGTSYFYNWKKVADVDASKTYASTAVVEGKKLTITPKFTFTSKAVVVPYVFNAKGEIVDLKDAAGTALIDNTNTNKQFIAKDLSSDKDLSAALDSTPAATENALELAQFNVNETGNGTSIWFQFNAILSSTSTDPNYGKYTLYRKATDATTAATKWVKVGDTYLIPATPTTALGTGEAKLQYIDVDAAASDADKKTNIKDAVINDFRLRKRKAAIVTTTSAKEFDYAKTSVYRLVCSIDNVEIYSAPVTVEDKFLDLKITEGANALTPSGFTTESPVTVKTYKFTSPCYIVDVTKTVQRGTAATVVESGKRLGPTNASRVKVELNAARTEITLTIDDETTAGTGDKIILTAFDAAGQSKQYIIDYKN